MSQALIYVVAILTTFEEIPKLLLVFMVLFMKRTYLVDITLHVSI